MGLDAVNSVSSSGGIADVSSQGASIGNDLSSLASSAGIDGGQLGQAIGNLTSAIESGDKSKIGQALGDLIGLMMGGGKDQAGEAGESGGAGKPGGESPAAGGSPATPSSTSGTGASEDGDLLSMIEKLLEKLGVPKAEIDKIVGALKEAGVGGSSTTAEGGTAGGEGIGGVKAA
jgi:hypothetical protein